MTSSYGQGASKGFLGVDLGSSEVREAQRLCAIDRLAHTYYLPYACPYARLFNQTDAKPDSDQQRTR